MEEPEPKQRRRASRNAGAFLGPGGTFPAAMRTLSDDIPGEPSGLEAEQRGPHPDAPPASLRERFLRWVRARR